MPRIEPRKLPLLCVACMVGWFDVPGSECWNCHSSDHTIGRGEWERRQKAKRLAAQAAA